jgi:hypothetical protein
MPACSNSRAKNGALQLWSSQPRRIFTLTGMRTASTTVRTRAMVLPASHIMAEPPPPRTTLCTGQPMLMSTDETPYSCSHCAASRISSGTDP